MKFSQNFAGISQNFSNFDEPDNFIQFKSQFGEKCGNFAENLLCIFGRQAVCKSTPVPVESAHMNLNSPGEDSEKIGSPPSKSGGDQAFESFSEEVYVVSNSKLERNFF